MTTQQHYEKCVEIYEKDGATGVCDYVLVNGLAANWLWCLPCENEYPHMFTDGYDTCMVCGSHR